VPALFGVWGPTLAFAALTLWLFSRSLSRPGDNPVSRGLDHLQGLLARGGRA